MDLERRIVDLEDDVRALVGALEDWNKVRVKDFARDELRFRKIERKVGLRKE